MCVCELDKEFIVFYFIFKLLVLLEKNSIIVKIVIASNYSS